MSEAILEMQNVEKRFGGVRAIDQFSLKVEPGMIYGLIGPNGAERRQYLIRSPEFIRQMVAEFCFREKISQR